MLQSLTQRLRLKSSFKLALIALALAVSPLHAFATKSVPKPPYYYVLDEPHVLDQRSLHALEALLIEHDRLTGEQVIVALFKSLEGEDLVDFTVRVFQQWGIGQRGKDNGALLALYWDDHKTRIEVGYGLEPVLTDAKSKQIIEQFLIPGIKAGDPSRAVTISAYQILTVLGSPLIQSGKAQEILRAGGISRDYNQPFRQSPPAGTWFVWFLLGGILLVIVLNILSAREAHFTRSGWFRPRPRFRIRSGGWWWGGFGGGGFGGGGGGWGGGLGGGGFSGGGGSSGGGGASGSW